MDVRSIRGNLQTRLRKLDEGQYSALILAAAGLKRLGLESRINRYFTADEIIPAAGQGILAVQGRKGEAYDFLEGYCDKDAWTAGSAERAFVKLLDGGCSSPVAAHAEILGDEIYLRGLYYNEKDGSYVTGTLRGNKADAESLGRELAETLRKKRRKQMKTGKVWLVGAGPGDIGLFTLKGLKVLEQADVVVYDSLVGQGVLSRIPEKCQADQCRQTCQSPYHASGKYQSGTS